MNARRRSLRAGGSLVLAGLLAAGISAAAQGMTDHDAAVLAVTAAGGALGAGALGWLAIRGLRRRPLGIQVLAVALVAVGASAVGALAAAEAMFISSHDLGALLVVLFASVAGGAGAATACAVSVADAATDLARIAQELLPGAGRHDASPAVGDLSDLAAQLRDTSVRLDEARAQAEALDASRRELVAWVSHDLRSPLASVRAMAEALEDQVLPDAHTVDRYHRAIRVETERLTHLVDELFELSRLTSRTHVADPDRAELGELADFAAAAGTSRGADRGVHVVADLEPGAADAPVPARDVARILANLVDNAVRHSRPASTVRVAGARIGETVELTVDDQCGGIPDADLRRVFDTAFRGDTARHRDEAGGGLGLPIARELAALLGGNLSARNHLEGCRFTLVLPCEGAPARLADVGTPRREPADARADA